MNIYKVISFASGSLSFMIVDFIIGHGFRPIMIVLSGLLAVWVFRKFPHNA